MNGHTNNPEDDEDDVSDDNASSTSGIPARNDSRSVSSTVHDRSRVTTTTAIKYSKRSSSQHPSQPQRPHSSTGAALSGSSPPSARETFLNLFFGQNGTAPVSNSTHVDRGHHSPTSHTGIVPIGKDVLGADPALTSGIMSGSRGMDGNNAAYDMKSLGRHIEAVSFICFNS